MSSGRRQSAAVLLATALCMIAGDRTEARAAEAVRRDVTVETVRFGDRHAAVKVVRGVGSPMARPELARKPDLSGKKEVVTFGTGWAEQVTVIRGFAGAGALAAIAPMSHTRIEKISFAAAGLPAVTVLRGSALRGPAPRDLFSVDLFGPASEGELNRIAFAVDGVESRHGADPRMWRPELHGPQGPMQVSAAAALDVGGGDRFDVFENRLLGRAYLAQMYRRYGNWTDAVAAYNWGPGNLDRWIAGGRNYDRMPLETLRYIELVLRGALVSRNAAGL